MINLQYRKIIIFTPFFKNLTMKKIVLFIGKHKIDDGSENLEVPTLRYFRSEDALTGVSIISIFM